MTNQSVVGRGLATEEDLEAIHQRMHRLLAERGAELDAIYHCPHVAEDGCACRKPRTELVERAARDLGFEPRDAFLIGDHASDMELGRRVGATTILVRTGHGADADASGADHVAADLAEAAGVIERRLAHPPA